VLSLLTPPPAYAVHAVRTREHTYTHTHTHTPPPPLPPPHSQLQPEPPCTPLFCNEQPIKLCVFLRHFCECSSDAYEPFHAQTPPVTTMVAVSTLTNPFMHQHHPSLPRLQSVRERRTNSQRPSSAQFSCGGQHCVHKLWQRHGGAVPKHQPGRLGCTRTRPWHHGPRAPYRFRPRANDPRRVGTMSSDFAN
jgi:hypothetical protein